MLESEFARGIELHRTFERNPWMQPDASVSHVCRADGSRIPDDVVEQSLTAFKALMKAVEVAALLCDGNDVSVQSAVDALLARGDAAYTELGMSQVSVDEVGPAVWMGLPPDGVALLHTWLWSVECWMGANLDDLQLVEFAVDGQWGCVGLQLALHVCVHCCDATVADTWSGVVWWQGLPGAALLRTSGHGDSRRERGTRSAEAHEVTDGREAR